MFRRSEFRRRHPSGGIDKSEFFQRYGEPRGHTPEVSGHLFDLIDLNKNGWIDCDEWICAERILNTGKLEEQLKCALSHSLHFQMQPHDLTLPPPPAVIFDFYDANQDGFITKDELLLISVPLHRFCFRDGSEKRQAQQVRSTLFIFGIWLVSDILDGSTSIIFLNNMTRTRTTN